MLGGTRWGSTGTICRDGLTVWHCARLLILASRARPFHGKTTAVLLLALYVKPASCCVPLLMAGMTAVIESVCADLLVSLPRQAERPIGGGSKNAPSKIVHKHVEPDSVLCACHSCLVPVC